MTTAQNLNGSPSDDLLFYQIRQLPEALKGEVLDFVGYLLAKHFSKRPKKNRPKFGSAKGKYKMAADFDAPLEIFKDYME